MDYGNQKNAKFGSGLDAKSGAGFVVDRMTRYDVECFDKNGNLKWSDTFYNIVTTVGLNDSLDKYFKGSGYTATWYLGLTDSSPTVAAGDTMSSHAGWTEDQNYSEGARQTIHSNLGTPAAGSVDNSASKAVFSINATTTIGGAFLTTDSTKGGTTGTLYGVAAFTEGDRAVVNGDTLNVTVTLTASSA